MKNISYKKLITLFLFLNILLKTPINLADSQNKNSILEKAQFSVFEVVFPQYSTMNLHSPRYQSTGSAFYIGHNQFVSAAHVFNLHLNRQNKDFYIRDKNKNIYKIQNIIKYSNQKDIIQFEVLLKKEHPFHALPIQTNLDHLNEVWSIGNKKGKGISTQKGTVTQIISADNNTKMIEFSGKIFHGNSGGPLINNRGEVVGIILKKNEDLSTSTALPINELLDLPKTHSSFTLRNTSESAFNQTLVMDWNVNIPLPQTLLEFSLKAQSEFLSFIQNRKKSFEEKFKNHLIPNHHLFSNFLKNQKYSKNFTKTELSSCGGRWFHKNYNYETLSLDDSSEISIAIGEDGFLFSYQKPKNISLKYLLNKPKLMLDAFLLASDSLKIFNKTEKSQIQNLNKPMDQKILTDSLGRNWVFSRWWIGYSKSSLSLYCLPTPQGSSCLSFYLPTSIDSVYDFNVQNDLKLYLISYQGTKKQWEEFLNLDSSFVPEALKNSKTLDKTLVHTGSNKTLFVKVGYAHYKSILKQEVHGFQWMPLNEKRLHQFRASSSRFKVK